MKALKLKHGGIRKGAGRKYKYGEKCKSITFRCPASMIPELKRKVKEILKSFEPIKTQNHV